MALAAGTVLGPYHVLGPLGAGGMGEVYRAHDTRLGRDVAVKVLPEDVAGDAERRGRFEREARAVAALDHPHICGIYDVGAASGTHYLVMPLLEGQTLATRLEKGAVPLAPALTIATEIADALDKAHRHGIVHRDLKPANVMLTKSGAKLLDFGLAKLRAPGGPIALSGTQTAATASGTAEGTILGTLHYMAPEQVEGKEADARSDVWALGATIYEMVTGERPFAGDTAASIIGAILKDQPPPVSSRQTLAPRALDDLVRRCLAKDPDDRWQSIGDVGKMLEGIAPVITTAQSVRAIGARRERTAWMAITALLVAALAFTSMRDAPVAPAAGVVRLSITTPAGTAFAPHLGATVPTPQFALSPDGRLIAFVAATPGRRGALWLRSLEDVDARLIQGTNDAQEPVFWSPDSRWIVFADAAGRLQRVAVADGTVQTIATGLADPRGGSWGRDDTVVFGTGYGGLYRVAASGGTPEPLTRVDGPRQEGSHRWPQLLPGGRHFLFTVRSGLADQRGIWVGTLADGTRRRLLPTDVDVHYVAPGLVLFLDGDTLLAQPFDADRLALSGTPTPVAARVGRSSRGNGAFAASSSGTLAYASAVQQAGRLTWFDRAGSPLGSVGPDGDHDYADFRLSPDETRLAASLIDPKLSLPDIWSMDLMRGGTSRWTFGPALNSSPLWSPAGDAIVFRTNRKGLTELYRKRPFAGAGDEPLLAEEQVRSAGVASSNLLPTDWSADGRHIALTAMTPSDIWLLPLGNPAKPVPFVLSPGDQMHGNFSPDGRYLAYTSNESGRYEVYVERSPVSDRKWPISTNGGYEPRWRADGRELYYLSEDRVLMAVPVSTGAVPFGVPRPLFQTRVHEGVSMLRTHYVPSRDGNRFLIHTRSGEAPAATITVVLNWRSLLPTP